MPTAAAVAAAAATAKIQAMEAVTNTAAVFGLSSESTSPRLGSIGLGAQHAMGSSSPTVGFGTSPRGQLTSPQLVRFFSMS